MATKQEIKAEKAIIEISETVKELGYRSQTVSGLFKNFGYAKRSSKNIPVVIETLRMNELFVHPEITLKTDWKETVRIYNFPVHSLGVLFDSEKELEDFIAKTKAYKKLGISTVERQFSPKGTRDKFDFKGTTAGGTHVALELKNKDGGKTSVEQVLRYIGMLKASVESKEKVKGILVTGIKSVETAHALYGLKSEDLSSISWYIYNYTGSTISFELVDLKKLEKYLKR